MMGLAVLIGIFRYWAFFPLSKFQFWTFVLAGVCCLTWLAMDYGTFSFLIYTRLSAIQCRRFAATCWDTTAVF